MSGSGLCKRGHALTPDNVYWNVDRRGGAERHYPKCKTCARQYQVQYRRKKVAEVQGKEYTPKYRRPNPIPRDRPDREPDPLYVAQIEYEWRVREECKESVRPYKKGMRVYDTLTSFAHRNAGVVAGTSPKYGTVQVRRDHDGQVLSMAATVLSITENKTDAV